MSPAQGDPQDIESVDTDLGPDTSTPDTSVDTTDTPDAGPAGGRETALEQVAAFNQSPDLLHSSGRTTSRPRTARTRRQIVYARYFGGGTGGTEWRRPEAAFTARSPSTSPSTQTATPTR